MRLKDLYWRPMTTEPPFPGNGVKMRTLLLRDKQRRVWEVQANRRTFPMLTDKYPDAAGWAMADELLLPEYSKTGSSIVEGKPLTVAGYKTIDRKDLERYYEQECEFSRTQFHRSIYWEEAAMTWRKRYLQLKNETSKSDH